MADASPPLHPDIAPLAFLLGTWRGAGKGDYPTIEDFEYGEEVRFWHVGKPFLAYAQRTWDPKERRPLHAETGYWRLPGGGDRVELVLAHPSGVVEIEEGSLAGTRIELKTTTVATTTAAKSVSALRRLLHVDGDELRYELDMAAVGVPMTHHLQASLRREPDA